MVQRVMSVSMGTHAINDEGSHGYIGKNRCQSEVTSNSFSNTGYLSLAVSTEEGLLSHITSKGLVTHAPCAYNPVLN